MNRALLRHDEPAKLRDEVAHFLNQFPLYPLHYSLDRYLDESFARGLIEEIVGW
jgi:hypothetical protein